MFIFRLRIIKNATKDTTTTTALRVVPTDIAIIVLMDIGEVELSGEGYPASTAAVAAMRSYKQTGCDGVVIDMAHRTWLLLVSQLNTFWVWIGGVVGDVSQSGSHAPHSQSHPSLEP
jgi:hypothetical protein